MLARQGFADRHSFFVSLPCGGTSDAGSGRYEKTMPPVSNPSLHATARPVITEVVRARRIARRELWGNVDVMQDLIWIAIMLGLLALTLAYIRLCDQA